MRKGEALTLAHEVGHSLGLSDIYVSNDESETNVLPADLLSVRSDMVRREFVPEDWSNDCGSGYNGKGIGGSRYYRAGLKMSELIPRLLMYGIDSPRSRDIPLGPVYGVWYKWIDGNKRWSKDFVPIGIGTPSLFDVHRTHQ